MAAYKRTFRAPAAATALMMLIVVFAPLAAGTPDGARARNGTVATSGYVYEGATALYGVEVTATNDSMGFTNTTYTDSSGRYLFNLAAANYTLSFRKWSHNYTYRVVEVVDGQGQQNVSDTFLGPKTWEILVAVQQQFTSAPVTGAAVELRNGTGAGLYAAATTNSSGAVRFLYTYGLADNPRADLTARASAPAHRSNSTSFSFYQSVWTSLWVGLNLTPTTGGLSGRVQNGAGAGVAGAVVRLAAGGFHARAVTNATGYYGFTGVPAGSAEVRAFADGYYGATAYPTVQGGLVRTQDIILTAVTRNRGATVWGYITESAGRAAGDPVEGALAVFSEGGGATWLAVESGSGGYYSASLPGGEYRITVEKGGYLSGNLWISVSDGESRETNLALAPRPVDSSVVSGAVTGTGPVAGVLVSLTDVARGGTNTTVSDDNGLYSINTYPGSFRVEARREGYFTNISQIEVAEGQPVGHNISLAPLLPETLRAWGYVKDGDGKPVAGAPVGLYDLTPTHGRHTSTTTTGAGGYYSLDTYAGDFLLLVESPGYAPALSSVSVTTVKRSDVVLSAAPAVGMEQKLAFPDWNNLTLTLDKTDRAAGQRTRLAIDFQYGNGDGVVDASEAALWRTGLSSRHLLPDSTKDIYSVGGVYYGIVPSTYAMSVSGAEGNITGAAPLVLSYTANYTGMNSTLAANQSQSLTMKVTYDSAAENWTYTVVPPKGFILNTFSSAPNMTVAGRGTATATVAAGTGTGMAGVLLNFSMNGMPSASAGGNFSVNGSGHAAFNASKSTDDFGIVNYTWDFGDGTMGYGVSVEHNYTEVKPAEGMRTYTVNLTVTDTAGERNTTSITVVVDAAPPVAVITIDTVNTTVREDADAVSFNGSSSSDNDAIATYTWDFGDGGVGIGAVAIHTFQRSGVYNVTLTVTDRAGHASNSTKVMTVLDATPPVAIAVPSSASPVAGDAVTFNASTSYDPDGGTVAEYNWNFGDSTTGTGAVLNHTYPKSGTYNVTLTIKDRAGNAGNTTMPIVVIEKLQLADLLVTAVRLEPAEPVEGSEASIVVTIYNNGTANADMIVIRAWLDSTLKIGETKVNVPAGKSATATIKWAAPKKGERNLRVSVDPDNLLRENIESNNDRAVKVTVKESSMATYILGGAVMAVVVAILVVVLRRRKGGEDEDEDEDDEEESLSEKYGRKGRGKREDEEEDEDDEEEFEDEDEPKRGQKGRR